MKKSERTLRIIREIDKAGIKQSAVAKHLNISATAVSRWFNLDDAKANVSERHITALASLLNVSEDYLLTGKGEPSIINDDMIVCIPLIDVKASAGLGELLCTDEQVLKSIEIDKAWLHQQCYFTHPNNLSVITATGDSMMPTISHGDFLLVDQGIDSIRTDSIYVAVVNDNLYVKRFQQTPRNTLLMISDNTAYEKFELDPNRDDIRIIGKVIFHWHGEKR